jgi:ankyrin repeat protein
MVVKSAKLPATPDRPMPIAVSIVALLSGLIASLSVAIWFFWYQEIEAQSGYHSGRALLLLSSVSLGIVGFLLAVVGVILSCRRSPWAWLMVIANCLVAVLIFGYAAWPRTLELMVAVKRGNVARVERYARMGVDLDAPSRWGWTFEGKGRTPLTQAIENGDAAIARVLIEEGAQVNLRDGHGDAPLNVAVLTNGIELIDLLLKHGADINQSRPLGTAVRYGRLHLVPVLLAKGADDSDDALFISLANDDVHLKAWGLDESKVLPVIRDLAAHGADLKRKDQNGRTPLTMSIHLQRKAYARVLVECGADIHGEDGNHETPLEVAARTGDLETIQLLLKAKADVNRGSPLSAALMYGELPAAETLLEAGADINQESQSRQPIESALTGSVLHMRPEILRFALDHGAKPMRQNLRDNRNSPLAGAVESNAKDLVSMLLDAGADPNEKHQDWSSPLRVAVERGNLEMVKLLVARGADVNRSGDPRRTLLAIAKREQEPEIEEFLRQQGAK